MLSAGLRQAVLEAFACKRLPRKNGSLDIYGGIRYWNNDIDVSLDPGRWDGSVSASRDPDWVDPVVGVRWTQETGRLWTPYINADLGGFGAGSDFTWSFGIGTFYKLSHVTSLKLAYKKTAVDYEEGTEGTEDYFAYDTDTAGMVFGVQFNF